jgi:hypothetical protein
METAGALQSAETGRECRNQNCAFAKKFAVSARAGEWIRDNISVAASPPGLMIEAHRADMRHANSTSSRPFMAIVGGRK